MLSFHELNKLSKKDPGSLPGIKVALLGDSATQFLAAALKGAGIERGFAIDLLEAEYNQVERQVMDRTSDLYRFSPDVVIVFQSTHKLLNRYGEMPLQKRNNLAEDRLRFIRLLCSSIRSKVICYNYPEIDDAVFGSFANKVTSSFTYQVRKLNVGLMDLAVSLPNLFVCDLASIQNKLGRDLMFDASIYTNTEMVLSLDCLPLIAFRTLDIICAMNGKLRKCLILDLDNTIWGGVSGDDGPENIQLGHGLGIGKVFSELQLWIKKLKDRGVILAVCSKNTESVAKEPFETHPDMILRLDDIAVFMANWENKVDNIRQIQSILNIGFDSMVFLDDNPFEREIVRQGIPGITVPELPDNPEDYLEFLYNENLFETVSYSETDNDRTRQYQNEAMRVEQKKTFTNESDYLKSLGMVSLVEGFTKFNIPRVAQLSQRSNQFNLRTVRYTDGDIQKLADDHGYICFAFHLEDKFGDNGLVCVIILRIEDSETLFVDTWLMSCRVLKRGMEVFTLNTVVSYAREHGFRKLIGEYVPTRKNAMVADHYTSMGFTRIDGSDRNLFELKVECYKNKECFISRK